MVDSQLDSPFDVSSENSLQTEKKGGKVLTFLSYSKKTPNLTEMLLHSPYSFCRPHLQQVGRGVASARNKN